MKIMTLLGVAAAAAAVAVIAAVAPARADAAAGERTPGQATVAAAERAPEPFDPSGWVVTLTGFFGMGLMLRAGRSAWNA